MSRALQPKAFFYLAATSKGGRTLGLRSSASQRALAAALRRDRLVLLRAWGLPAWVSLGEQRLALKDPANLNPQLARLLSRGVPMVEALEVDASVVSPPARPVVERMRESVAGGDSFAEACVRTRQFDLVSVAVYRASEQSGDLAGAAKSLAETALRRIQIAQRVITVMMYPLIVITIATLVTGFLLTYVVPQIGKVLEQREDSLPFYTKIVLASGSFMQAHWMWVLMGGAAALVLLFAARRRVGPAMWAIVRRTPMVKGVLRTQDAARFFDVMSAMTRSGVPLADALGVGVEAVGDPRLGNQLSKLRRRLIEGGVLRSLIDGVTALPLATRKLLVAADRAGDLESALESLAQDTGERLKTQSERLLGILEPAVIVLMFLVIGSLVLSLMVPLLSISQSFG